MRPAARQSADALCLRRKPGLDGEVLGSLKHGAYVQRIGRNSRAFLAVVQAQDILGLGSESRMNTPATVGENWR
ncbi:hypothetical protein F7P78_01685 [Fusobacterium naviforme]|nr:hypothetical protein F7P78_01685 [Fusobacterium naviforme]